MTAAESESLEKKAQRGVPSYVWRAGQERRLRMIEQAAGARLTGHILDNGCGIGAYVERLASISNRVTGLEIEVDRAQEAHRRLINVSAVNILSAAGEALPFEDNTFDLVLSHEVLEHVQNDRLAASEMVRVLRPGGRITLFVPNRGYPFETHGIYWQGRYHFGNIPLVNYLPRALRDRLAPHVRVYSTSDLKKCFAGLPVRIVQQTIIFGAYDNIIARWKIPGRILRAFLQGLENMPLRFFGLSHFWVIEKNETPLLDQGRLSRKS